MATSYVWLFTLVTVNKIKSVIRWKLTHHCKSTILQLKKKKKKNVVPSCAQEPDVTRGCHTGLPWRELT